MRDPKSNAYIVNEWETVDCPVCLSNRCKEYERFGSNMQYRYVKCLDCSLIYSSPRPVYNQDFIDCCYASYAQYVEGMTIEDLDSVHTSGVSMFQKEIRHLLQYDLERTNVLDIGSGMGTFLLAAKPFYKQLTGLDVSAKMAAFVSEKVGVQVRLEQFEDHKSEELYSLIHMSHVIEHIPNPNQWLQHAHRLLKTNGVLVINVPNKFSISNLFQHTLYKAGLKKQFSKAWNEATRTPDHLYEPTIASFKKLIAQNHFEILEYFTYSRKDPISKANPLVRFLNRTLHWGSNISFILRPLPYF